MNGTTLRIVFTTGCISLIAACSSLDTEAAKKLAQTGVAASTAAQTDALDMEQAVAVFEDRAILAAVTDAVAACRLPKCDPDHFDVSPIAAPSSDKVAKLAALLRARTNAADELVEAYRGFENLANYDAVGEMEKSIGNLFDSTNHLITAANALMPTQPIAPITDTAKTLVQIGAGLLAEEVHKHRIQEASRLMRVAISRHAAALKVEEDVSVSLRVVSRAKADELLITLRSQGVVGYADTIKPVIVGLGSAPVAELEKAVRASRPLQAGLDRMLQERSKREEQAVRQKYSELIAAVASLETAHKELEAGKPMDLAEIRYWIKRIMTYRDRLKAQ
jgi:hypothetical protein